MVGAVSHYSFHLQAILLFIILSVITWVIDVFALISIIEVTIIDFNI